MTKEELKVKVAKQLSIIPMRGYNGEIEIRINPAEKDGTRSNREFVLWSMEIDSIKKID